MVLDSYLKKAPHKVVSTLGALDEAFAQWLI